jgi:hypothetical protein
MSDKRGESVTDALRDLPKAVVEKIIKEAEKIAKGTHARSL